jgi:hypothetical protein
VLRDWGLYLDVTTNIDTVEDGLARSASETGVARRLAVALDTIEDAIAEEEKTFRWRLRSRFGKRLAWRREMEDTDGSSLVTVEEAAQRAAEEAAADVEWSGWSGWEEPSAQRVSSAPCSHPPRCSPLVVRASRASSRGRALLGAHAA